VIRRDSIEIGDRMGGLLRRVDNTSAGYDFQTLSSLMQQLKARYPDKLAATILAEPDTAYDTLVHTMDAVRIAKPPQGGRGVELFPEISVGDAPLPGKAR